jgi:hypothetical protein
MMRFTAVLALLLAGCASAFGGRTDGDAEGTGFGRKKVVSKRPPIHLVAWDRTVCSVSEEQYRKTGLGEAIWCHWRRDPEAIAGRDRSGPLTPDPAPWPRWP